MCLQFSGSLGSDCDYKEYFIIIIKGFGVIYLYMTVNGVTYLKNTVERVYFSQLSPQCLGSVSEHLVPGRVPSTSVQPSVMPSGLPPLPDYKQGNHM